MQEIRTSGSMSGDGKRSVAAWPKLPRPSSTLPLLTTADARGCPQLLAKADMRPLRRDSAFDPLRSLAGQICCDAQCSPDRYDALC